MFCKNCGKELDANAKFCMNCGTPVEQVAPNSIKDKDEPQVNYSVSSGETNNVLQNFSPSSSEKKGKVKFKDLPKRKKIISILICLIGLSVFLILTISDISDGFSGTKKSGESNIAEGNNNPSVRAVEIIPYDCDTGAVFDMTLSEFSNSFSNACREYASREIPLNNYWGNPVLGTEDSGTSYQLYTAIFDFTGSYVLAKVINNHIASISIVHDYLSDSPNLQVGLFYYSALAFENIDADEAEKILDNLSDTFNKVTDLPYELTNKCDENNKTTSYIRNGIKYSVIPDQYYGTKIGYTFSIDPVTEKYVHSLSDNIIN